jgi:hypothetical protein
MLSGGPVLTGFFGVASAASMDQPVTTPDTTSNVVGKRTQHVNPDSARLPGTQAAISARALWCGISGDFHLNATGLGAFDGQPVAVTVVQAGTGGSEFFGAARMRVNNVLVWGGNVTAWVTVEWTEPLCIWTSRLSGPAARGGVAAAVADCRTPVSLSEHGT